MDPPKSSVEDLKKSVSESALRRSKVASVPLDPSVDTYMGASVGAKPGPSVSDVPKSFQDAAANLVSGDNVARRRRERPPRRTVETIDPNSLNDIGINPELLKAASAEAPVEEAKESSAALSALMANTPSPEPQKQESKPVPAESEQPKEEIKVDSKEEPNEVKSVPKTPEKPVEAAKVEKESELDDKLVRLKDYDAICQYFVPNKDPSAHALVEYLQPLIKEELPTLKEKVDSQAKEVLMLKDQLAQKDSEIAEAKVKVAEMESRATNDLAANTNAAIENAVINDEDVNKLRNAFEDHMENYQKSMDQFQSFFDKITKDLESSFEELGIQDDITREATSSSTCTAVEGNGGVDGGSSL